MLSDDLRTQNANLERKLQSLRLERHRLDELTHAYTVTERSKFAVIRSIWRGFRALAGKPQPVSRFIARSHSLSLSPRTAASRALTEDSETEQLLLQLQADRDQLYELLETERRETQVDGSYQAWLAANALRDSDLRRLRDVVPLFRYRPLVSIIVPAYNTPDNYLRAMLDSMLHQVYPHWELCIADDKSTKSYVRATLTEYAERDPRIKLVFRETNGHISAATNSALDLATGEYVGLLDHDDMLTPDALFEVVTLLGNHPDADMMYSDEDKIDDNGRLFEPHFKPDWSPESFLSRNYTSHFSVYRRSLVEELGRMREGFEGSQDYDLVLRLTERTDRVYHIPRVLYHWRSHAESNARSGSAKEYAFEAAQKALREAAERRGEPATVSKVWKDGVYSVRFAIREKKRVSVIIPTRDHGDDVDRCLTSVFGKTTYPDFDVTLLDNGSTDKASLATFDKWARRESRLKVLRYDAPFNFSKLMNYGVDHTDGHYVLLLNNDTAVITPDWMTALVEQGQREPVGAVGAHLFYEDGTFQHAGVVIGLGSVAGHSQRRFPGNHPGYFCTLLSLMNTSAVTAACLLVRRSVYKEVNGFDEELAVGFNDVDFCLKIRNAGYRNVTVPYAKLYHYESKSRGFDHTSPEKAARAARECALMIERWRTTDDPDPFYNINLTLDREDYAITDRARPLAPSRA